MTTPVYPRCRASQDTCVDKLPSVVWNWKTASVGGDDTLDLSRARITNIGDMSTGPHTFFDKWAMDSVFFLRVLEGSAEILETDARPMTVPAGSFVVLFPGRLTTLHLTETHNRMVYVSLRGLGMAEALLRFGYHHRMTACVDYGEEFFNQLFELYAGRPQASRDPDVLGLCQILLTALARRVRNTAGNARLFDAIRQINAMSRDAFTTKSAAAMLGVSRATLDNLFRHGGMPPPGEYIANVRLILAQEALIDTRDTVYEIARRLGFSGPTAFAAFFRRNLGLTPTQYRDRPVR